MTGGVSVLNGEDLVAMREQPYDSEEPLQALRTNYPELIAGEPARGAMSQRWLLVRREVGISDSAAGACRWSLDHLLVDEQAAPTLVEVKGSDDTRIRSEVVGHMLDYAANGISHWPAARLRSDFAARTGSQRYGDSTRSWVSVWRLYMEGIS